MTKVLSTAYSHCLKKKIGNCFNDLNLTQRNVHFSLFNYCQKSYILKMKKYPSIDGIRAFGRGPFEKQTAVFSTSHTHVQALLSTNDPCGDAYKNSEMCFNLV